MSHPSTLHSFGIAAMLAIAALASGCDRKNDTTNPGDRSSISSDAASRPEVAAPATGASDHPAGASQ